MPTVEPSAPRKLAAADLKPRGGVHPSPADWRDQTLYFLLPDRFSDGNEAQRPVFDRADPQRFRTADKRAWMEAGKNFQGGSLRGIAGKLDYLKALGVAREVVVTDGIRYRMYAADDFAPIAYANLARLKQSALGLFARMKRP